MSLALLKSTIKANRLLWVIILGVLTLYLFTIISMYDPEGAAVLNQTMSLLPEALISAMGFTITGNSLLTFVASLIYGFLVLLFPLIYSIVCNNRLVAGYVDRGSMVYLLSTPNSRQKIAVTQAVFSVGSITALIGATAVVGIVVSQLIFPGALDVGKFILLNIYLAAMYWVIGGIGFLASCAFSETKYSLALGAGLPLLFLFLKMLGNSGEKVAWIGKLSIWALFNPDRLIAGDPFWGIASLVMVVLAGLLYGSAIVVFKRRDLPL
jgi:ABC-2 type transport system permease protein